MALELTRNFPVIAASGSTVVLLEQGPHPTAQSVALVVNVIGAVLNPGSVTFTIQEVDPQNPATVIGTNIATGAAIAAAGAQPALSFGPILTGAVRITWTVLGAGFSAANVDVSLLSSVAGAGGSSNAVITGPLANGAVVVSNPKNPTAEALGSQAATQASVALGAATAYTGGIAIWNSNTMLSVFVGHGAVTAAPGANKICLGPGEGYIDASGDLSAIQIIAETGSPIVNWVGLTL